MSNKEVRTDKAWLDAHWMPFTGNREFKAHPRMFVSADGSYYTDAGGKRVFDGLSGLWCCGLGHARREIVATKLLDLIALHDASNIAAVIIEPMAGSAGVIPPPVGYLQRIRDICTANNILLIFDEVITGFGRMGAYTGADAFGVVPDLLNFAKQVTNGVQPLGGIVAKKEIYDTMMGAGGPEYMLELPHGYTYSAHPVACAAGVAALELLVKDRAVERVAEL